MYFVHGRVAYIASPFTSSHFPTPSSVSCCACGSVPSAIGERFSSSVPPLLTVSTSHPITVPGGDTVIPVEYPHVLPIGWSTIHGCPARIPGGDRVPIFSKSKIEPICFVSSLLGAYAM